MEQKGPLVIIQEISEELQNTAPIGNLFLVTVSDFIKEPVFFF